VFGGSEKVIKMRVNCSTYPSRNANVEDQIMKLIWEEIGKRYLLTSVEMLNTSVNVT
jgi:hypothetical protein